MSRQSFLCPKCGKAVRRISMSGGSVVYQGLPVPDPDDFCITIHPCRCSAAKGEGVFPTFVNVWQQAYCIPEVRATAIPPNPRAFASVSDSAIRTTSG
jgi:hypothetical protein